MNSAAFYRFMSWVFLTMGIVAVFSKETALSGMILIGISQLLMKD